MVRIFNLSLLTLYSQIYACEGSCSFINNDKTASVIDDWLENMHFLAQIQI
jgi:hypothetical protein